MRILIYGINYYPDLTGIGKYTGEMSSWLANHGHTVDVITAMPYYPQWQIPSSYKGKWWHKEYIDGVKVYRCPLYVPRKLSSLKRIIHEFSFVLSSLPIWLKKMFSKKYDIIISIAPPFHLGMLPMIYSKLRGSVLITHVQDLQVDVAKNLGMLRESFFLKIMFKIERFLYKRSAAVSTISEGLQRKIKNKSQALSSCFLFPNWVDEKTIRPLSKEESLRQRFRLSPSDKVVLYSGNLGAKQGLENIIEVAKAFQEEKEIKFVIVGNGGTGSQLQKIAKEEGVTNIQFHELVPYEQLPALLAMADLHLVLQKKYAADLVMPSKLTGILAAGGCPLVTAAPGTTLHEIICKYNMGIVAEPESCASLINGIRHALSNDLNILRKNAREYAKQFLSKEVILRNWENQLVRLTAKSTKPAKKGYLVVLKENTVTTTGGKISA